MCGRNKCEGGQRERVRERKRLHFTTVAAAAAAALLRLPVMSTSTAHIL